MNADSKVLVVRYSPDARAEYAAQLASGLRTQARALIALGVLLAVVMILAPVFVFVVEERPVTLREILLLAVLAVPPVGFAVLGVRKLRRKALLPDVVLAITDEHVTLGAMQHLDLFTRSRPELRWDRRATRAKLVPGLGTFTYPRMKFTLREGRRRRTQYLVMAALDTSAEDILAAMRRP